MRIAFLSGYPEAAMCYTIEGYAETIVCTYGLKLVGWPVKVNFADLSRVGGGCKTLGNLLELWKNDTLKFEPASELERLNAALDPTSVAPAEKYVHRKEPGGRNDIGRARYRWKTNPDGSKPLRRPKDGPKSDKVVVDSDGEDALRGPLRLR